MWEERWKIIDEYNKKAEAFNEKLVTQQERERNVKFGTMRGDDETRAEYSLRVSKWHQTMYILPNTMEP
jgi:hypothetical protein